MAADTKPVLALKLSNKDLPKYFKETDDPAQYLASWEFAVGATEAGTKAGMENAAADPAERAKHTVQSASNAAKIWGGWMASLDSKPRAWFSHTFPQPPALPTDLDNIYKAFTLRWCPTGPMQIERNNG